MEIFGKKIDGAVIVYVITFLFFLIFFIVFIIMHSYGRASLTTVSISGGLLGLATILIIIMDTSRKKKKRERWAS